MKVLKSWLKDRVDFDLSNEELADWLSLSGTAVESFNEIDAKIIVAEIKEIAKHPNADKLQIAQVFTGKETLQIVCGAPNIAVGQKVPLAQIGAKIVDGTEIKHVQLRGVDSHGMLCAGDELGLSGDHLGIIILNENCQIGEPVSKYLEFDTVFELETTANRGDELSHIGVSREIAALLGRNISDSVKTQELFMPKGKGLLNIEIKDELLCPQYTGILIKNIKVEASPDWLQKKLIAIGLNPINNIVDITNYIMFDTGQPLHAFDADKVNNKNIIVRSSSKDEKIIGLDSKEYTLPEGTLVIADDAKPIAIAGIIGGKNSHVEETTKNIILESAEFDSVSVRRTSKRINLSTEASYRFERKIDSGSIQYNGLVAAKLISDIAGGDVVEVLSKGSLPEVRKVKIDLKRINDLTGLNLNDERVKLILNSLGFVVLGNVAEIPFWRHDVNIWQDLSEEIARIYGYQKIPRVDIPVSTEPKNLSYYFKEYIKDLLAECGFSEIFGYAFLSDQDLKVIDLSSRDLLEVANPIQPENKFLRNSLFPTLLKGVAKNPSFDPVLIFEIGHIFTDKGEKTNLGIVASGKNSKQKFEQAVKKISKALEISLEIIPTELSREHLNRFKIRKPVTYIAEIDLAEVLGKIKFTDKIEPLQTPTREFSYKEVSKYPPVVRDLAFIISDKIANNTIEESIMDSNDNISLVDLFDEFVSDKFGAGNKSIAFHIYFQDLNRALTDIEADEKIKTIVETLSNKFGAQLRDS